MQRLFVYGTLRRHFQNEHARLLADQGIWIGPARLRGRLYHLGSYPGMVLTADAEWVSGELYQLRDGTGILAELDEYEQSAGFSRVSGGVVAADGEDLPAWVYIYDLAVNETQRIVSGDYAAHLGIPPAVSS